MIRLIEVNCDNCRCKLRHYRETPLARAYTLALAKMWSGYGSSWGHELRVQGFNSTSGAHREDVKKGEGLFDFFNTAFARTARFCPTCIYNAMLKSYNKNTVRGRFYTKHVPYLLAGAMCLYDPKDILKQMALGYGEPRPVSLAALDKRQKNKKGERTDKPLYTFEDRPEWFRDEFDEEYVLSKKNLVSAKVILLTDNKYRHFTLKELTAHGELDIIQGIHPELHTIVKFNGLHAPFASSPCVHSSGEDHFDFYVEYMMYELMRNHAVYSDPNASLNKLDRSDIVF